MEFDSGSPDELSTQLQHAYNLLLAKEYGASRELFDQLFDGKDKSIAAYLGYIHSQMGTSEYNRDLALAYFRIAASEGDAYSQHSLAGMLLEDGREEEAVRWYKLCSEQGNAECSYALAGLFKHRSDKDAAEIYLNRAVEQGHALAIQHLAIRYILGMYGLRKIGVGLSMYLKNLRNLYQYARNYSEGHIPFEVISRN